MFANNLINQAHAGLSVSVPQSCEHPSPKAWGSHHKEACFLKLYVQQLRLWRSFLPSIATSLFPFKIANCT